MTLGILVHQTGEGYADLDVQMASTDGPRTLTENINKPPCLSDAEQVSRVADGYQPSLVSPENGMRKLASDALDQVVEPVNKCVQQVYMHLINSAR